MKNESSILKKVERIRKIFDFFGFSLKFNYARKVQFLITIIVLIYLAYNLIMSRVESSIKLGNLQLYTQLISWIYAISSVLKGFTCLFQLIYSSKKLQKLFDMIEEIDKIFVSQEYFKFSYKKIKSEIIFCNVICLIFYFTLVTCFRHKGTNSGKLIEMLRTDVPFVLLLIYIQKFIFLVQILNFYVNLLNEYIMTISNLLKNLSNRRDTIAKCYHQIIVFSRIYELLHESSKLLTESFDLALLVQLSTGFSSVINQGLNLFKRIKNNQIYDRNASGIAMNIFNFLIFHFYTQKLLKSVSYY